MRAWAARPRLPPRFYLSGVGVAKQRKAIVDGLRSSIVDFSENIEGTSTKEVMELRLDRRVLAQKRRAVAALRLLCNCLR